MANEKEFQDNVEAYKQALEEEFETINGTSDASAVAEAWRKYLLPTQGRFAERLKYLALYGESESVQLSALKFIHAMLVQHNEDADPDALKRLLNDLRTDATTSS